MAKNNGKNYKMQLAAPAFDECLSNAGVSKVWHTNEFKSPRKTILKFLINFGSIAKSDNTQLQPRTNVCFCKEKRHDREILAPACYGDCVLTVTAKKVMTVFFFFAEIAIISDYIARTPKIVARKKSNLQIFFDIIWPV